MYNSLIFPHFLLAATRFGLVVKRTMSGDGFLACSSPACCVWRAGWQSCHHRKRLHLPSLSHPARRRPALLERKPNVTQPAKEKKGSCGIEYCMEPLVRGTNMKSILNITTGSPSGIMVIHVICSLSTAPRLWIYANHHDYVNLCKRNYNQSCFDEKPVQESKWTIFGHKMYSFVDEEHCGGTDQLTYSGALFHANSRPNKVFTFKHTHLSAWPYHKRSGSSSNYFHFFCFSLCP